RGALSGVRAEIPGVVSLRAERVDVHLRLLPLFRGRAEIASVSLTRPEVRLDIAQTSKKEKSAKEAQADPVEAYRAAVDAIRTFAPESVLDVDGGKLEVLVSGMPPLRLRDLEIHASTAGKGMELELSAAGDAWRALKATARVEFGDHSGTAKL